MRRLVRDVLSSAATRIWLESLTRENADRDCGKPGHGACSMMHAPLSDVEPHVLDADRILRRLSDEMYQVERSGQSPVEVEI